MSDGQGIKTAARKMKVLQADPDSGRVPEAAETADGYDAMMKAQAEALTEISGKVLVSGTRGRDGMEQVIAKLEARLSLNEQAVTALQQRYGDKIAGLDVDTNALAERLHGLRQRLEKFEEKQGAALAELRLEVFNLTHPRAGEAKINPAPEPAVMLEPLAPTPDPEGEADDSEAVARAITYLDTARRAAIEASERQASLPVKPKPAASRFWRKHRWVILSAAAVLVVWFDAYVFAHYQPAEGAVAQAAPAAATIGARAELLRGLAYLKTGDAAKALPFLVAAAQRQEPVAEQTLGRLYQSGTGVAADMKTAAGWYERAAAKGNLKAMGGLGKLYAGGWSAGIDFSKAARWFAKAASYGDVDAAFNLAVLYERGLGVPADLTTAYRWYGIAAARGDGAAAERASALSARFRPAQQQELNAAIAAFEPVRPDPAANEAL